MLGRMQHPSQIKILIGASSSLSITGSLIINAKSAPFVTRTTATIISATKKLPPYELCGTSVIGPDFRNRHIPNEAEQTLRMNVPKKNGSTSGFNDTIPQFRGRQPSALPLSPPLE